MGNGLGTVKSYLSESSIKTRFNEILGKKAPQFMASIVNTVSGSKQLMECKPESIMGAAFIAAALDLPIEPNLGFAAIVPYRDNGVMKAQFQMMYKGYIQLAIRSGYYEGMNYTEVYEDEVVSYNPVKGELILVDDFASCTQRANNQTDKIVGYYAWFKLKTGFEKALYMTNANIEAHARRFSKAYQYDLAKNKKSSRWTTDFDAMGKKTVIKLLLSKWGILSVDMQRAIQDDQKVFDSNVNGKYLDNPESPVDVEASDPFETIAAESDDQEVDFSEVE